MRLPRSLSFLLVLVSGFGTMPIMAQNACVGKTFTVSPLSFHFPAKVDFFTVHKVNVSISPAPPPSTVINCWWKLVVPNSATAWIDWGQPGGLSNEVDFNVFNNCPAQPPRSMTLEIWPLDLTKGIVGTSPVAIVSLSQDAGPTIPALTNVMPAGNGSYPPGGNLPIAWTYTPSSDSSITDVGYLTIYNTVGHVSYGPFTVHLRTQSYTWPIPASTPQGTYNISISWSDSTYTNCSSLAGNATSGPFQIKNAPATVTCPANSGTVGTPYSSSLSGSGGNPPYTYSIPAGALPAGLALTAPTGAISGTPTRAGTVSFTAEVLDSSSSPGTASCTITVAPLPPDCTRDDVRNLLSHVPVSSTSHIYVTGPYLGGAVMLEDALDQGQSGAVKPVSLRIASSAADGTYCAYWIDDDIDPRVPPSYHYPSMKFNHPVRYAWTKHGDASEYGIADANNTLTIHPDGGRTPTLFTFSSDQTVSGVPVTFGSGDFAAVPIPATTVAASQDQAQLRDVQDAPALSASGCLSWALIIDGGDKRVKHNGDPEIASSMAADSDLMSNWLSGRGFSVRHISQYWDNAIPHPHYLTGAQRVSFFNNITNYVNLYSKTPTAAGCHHEFFLYVSSHGSVHPAAFFLYDSFGAGNNQGVTYDELFTRLNAFPTDLKHETTVYAMFDDCYSGAAVGWARTDFNVNNRPAHLALQVMTCASSDQTCPGGHDSGGTSATQDFMTDSKTMTTGFDALLAVGKGRNPMRLRIPDFAWAGWFLLDP